MVTKIQQPITVQGDDNKESLGLIHVIMGDGKGKTTSSLGLALRAIGAGLKVYMIQFLKSGNTGEIHTIRKYLPTMKIEQYGIDAIKERQKRLNFDTLNTDRGSTFIFQPDNLEKDAAEQGWSHAKNIIRSNEYDLVIMDEINCVLDKGLISMDEVIKILDEKPKVELVFTGRDPPQKLIELAHYVNNIQKIKNPWDVKIKARKGIEY